MFYNTLSFKTLGIWEERTLIMLDYWLKFEWYFFTLSCSTYFQWGTALDCRMASLVQNFFQHRSHTVVSRTWLDIVLLILSWISRDISEKDIFLKLVLAKQSLWLEVKFAGNLKYVLEVVVHTLTMCPCINMLYWCCIRKRTPLNALYEWMQYKV